MPSQVEDEVLENVVLMYEVLEDEAAQQRRAAARAKRK